MLFNIGNEVLWYTIFYEIDLAWKKIFPFMSYELLALIIRSNDECYKLYQE